MNIEPPRPPPPRGSYYRNRDGRDNWHGSNNRRDYDKDRSKDVRGGVGRFDRGGMRDRSHRPWRFDRDNGYNKYRGDKEHQYGRGDRHDKTENGGGYGGNKHNGNNNAGNSNQWNQNNSEDMAWQQYNGGWFVITTVQVNTFSVFHV